MVNPGIGTNNIFRVVEHILIEDIQNIVHGYLLLQVIEYINQIIPNPIKISALT